MISRFIFAIFVALLLIPWGTSQYQKSVPNYAQKQRINLQYFFADFIFFWHDFLPDHFGPDGFAIFAHFPPIFHPIHAQKKSA